MNYTVISKSGWETDLWKVQKTFSTRKKAQTHADKIHQRTDATQIHYNVQIKAHKKSLGKLLTNGSTVKFSDGTRAIW